MYLLIFLSIFRMAPFINAVKIPNVGIWFMGSPSKRGDTLVLKENGEWNLNGPKWTNIRTRACSVLISDTKVHFSHE